MLGRRFTFTAALLAAALICAPAGMSTASAGADRAAKPGAGDAGKTETATKADAKLTKKRVKKTLADDRLKTRDLFGLEWHDDWRAAVTRNRVDGENAKPIMFLRILGDLASET